MNKKKKLKPITPGEILLRQFLIPLKMSQNKLAIEIGVSPPRINALVKGKYRITPELALRLGCFFRSGPELWMNLQQNYDLEVAEDRLEDIIKKTVRPIDKTLLNKVAA